MGWSGLFSSLRDSCRQLDQQNEQLIAGAQASKLRIHCEKGCSNCCSLAVNCSFPEAAAVARQLTARQRQVVTDKVPLLREISLQAEDLKQFLRLFRQQMGGCPFLDSADGSCHCYSVRPFSCRALLSTRNSSWCGVDFTELHPQEKEAFLSSLDPEVVAFPTHYLAAPQEQGLELEELTMVAMRDRFGIAISGSLIYQVWLELEHQLGTRVVDGFSVTRDYLADNKLDLPFLLQLQAG